MNWTIDQVRAELPDVDVEWRGTVYVGRVRGRLNQVATVYLERFPEVSTEYSWATVTRALNQGLALNFC